MGSLTVSNVYDPEESVTDSRTSFFPRKGWISGIVFLPCLYSTVYISASSWALMVALGVEYTILDPRVVALARSISMIVNSVKL